MKAKFRIFVFLLVIYCFGYNIYLHWRIDKAEEYIDQIAGNVNNDGIADEEQFNKVFEDVSYLQQRVDSLERHKERGYQVKPTILRQE